MSAYGSPGRTPGAGMFPRARRPQPERVYTGENGRAQDYYSDVAGAPPGLWNAGISVGGVVSFILST